MENKRTDQKRESKKKKTSKKEKKYKNSISELNKEIKDLKSRLDRLIQETTSYSATRSEENKADTVYNSKKTFNVSKNEKETDQMHIDNNFKSELPKEIAPPPSVAKHYSEKPNKIENTNILKETLGDSVGKESDSLLESKNSELNFPNEKDTSSFLSHQQNNFKSGNISRNEEKHSNSDVLKSDSTSPSKKNTPDSTTSSSKTKKIKSKQKEKRKEKKSKKMKKLLDYYGFKDADFKLSADEELSGGSDYGNGHLNDLRKSERRSTIAENYFEEKGGRPQFPCGPGMESISESNTMYGTSLPLDDEFINDKYIQERSYEKSVSRFISSTLVPGDGYVNSHHT